MRMYRTRALTMGVELKHILKGDPNYADADKALKELRQALKKSSKSNSVSVNFDSAFIRPSLERMTDSELQAMKKEKDAVLEAAPKWEAKPLKDRPWNKTKKNSKPKAAKKKQPKTKK